MFLGGYAYFRRGKANRADASSSRGMPPGTS
jgi:hypothetical protein